MSSAKRILLVDDDADILKINRILLEREDYDVVLATNGEDALKIVKEGGVDLMVLDIVMPGVDGYEVCQRMQEMDVESRLPVLMLTAKADEADKIMGYFVGAADYLTKPYDKNVFMEKVRNLLGEATAE